jgi:hypothetical protein
MTPAPEQAPTDWFLRAPLARAAIGGAALVVLRAHPDKTGAGERDWLANRVLEHLQALRDAGDPGARVAITEFSSARLNNALLLRDVVGRLLVAGSLMLTLRAERTRLDAAIEQLAQLAGGPR